jgi:hypothetical protein
MVAWALATSHPQRLKSLTVLSTPHPIALQESRKADPKQDRRLDYVRFFRLRDGSPESALLADGARRLRAAFDPRVPKDLLTRLRRGLPSQEPFPRHSIGIAPLTMISTFPLARFAFRPSTFWGENDMALGEDAAMRTKDLSTLSICSPGRTCALASQ